MLVQDLEFKKSLIAMWLVKLLITLNATLSAVIKKIRLELKLKLAKCSLPVRVKLKCIPQKFLEEIL
jgi:hypothetical protein